MGKRFVYADNAATTAPYPEVIDEMMPYLREKWGNPSSIHGKGEEAKAALAAYREKVASLLGCEAGEIVFTSCGTEADNHAIRGAAYANAAKGKHIITTKVEHPAVLNTCKALEKEGFRVTYLDVDGEGRVSAEDVERAICEDTVLVSVMYANNEIGTIMPVREIAAVCHAHGVLCMTDAVQAVGAVPINVRELGVDMLTASGHKIHAPKGIGLLYIEKGTRIKNLIEGGGQERGRRGGTENLPYIAAFAKALEIAVEKLPDMARVAKMRDRLIAELTKLPRTRVNGSLTHRLPGNANISFECIEGESILLLMDMAGICCSTGSACSSNSLDPSHVLLAIGLPHEVAHGSVRITLAHENTEEDVDYIIEKLTETVERLRKMSPLWKE
ncbi:MAG: cysteine desulfurase NifS [Clostridia bacterium]|nr:cysteine desulfurase NifS [Clostridia bacterium]